MNCAKVLFSYLEKNIRFKRPNYVKKYLETVPFSQKSAKVKTYSTNVSMESLFDVSKFENGMKVLDKKAFNKIITVPCLIVTKSVLANIINLINQYMLRIQGLKAATDVENDRTRILIDPRQINSWNDIDENLKKSLISANVNEDNFSKTSIEITYDNWPLESLLKAVIPKSERPLTSYSVIGHIIQLNIKDNILDYRYVLGEILFDKIKFVKTVVYKKHFIDNVYRNFELEVVFGEPNFITTLKANGCNFKLDFSKVYWNPRLSTEHLRIVDLLKEKDVLFDVFAGIGPFSIPAAKKKCLVFANDLNPESIKWLEHNITLNKSAKGNIQTFNKDGKDFILEDCKKNLIKIWSDEFDGCIHVVMNLPILAPSFVKYFNKIIKHTDMLHLDVEKIKKCLPIVHCYFFVRDKDKKTLFEEVSGMKLDNVKHSFHFVRNVSGSASMFRITLTLPLEYLVEDYANENVEPLPKRICLKESKLKF